MSWGQAYLLMGQSGIGSFLHPNFHIRLDPGLECTNRQPVDDLRQCHYLERKLGSYLILRSAMNKRGFGVVKNRGSVDIGEKAIDLRVDFLRTVRVVPKPRECTYLSGAIQIDLVTADHSRKAHNICLVAGIWCRGKNLQQISAELFDCRHETYQRDSDQEGENAKYDRFKHFFG